jgi:DNA-binding transcriptional MerR regulator
MQIGDLARLTHISVRMLRHYDEIDLFKPTLIRENTYREYSVSQLPVLNRILALKDLGFSLEQIRTLVREGFAAQRLRDLLELRRNELETHISQESERLNKVQQRLSMMDQEKTMTNYTVSVKSLPAQLVASVRDPNLDEFQSHDGGTTTRSTQKYFRTLYDHLEQHGQAVGTPFTIIGHPPVDEGSTLLDVEIIKAITRSVPESQSVRVYELSAVPIMACLEYRGPNNWQVIENQALPALYAWVEDNGFKVVGPIRQAITVMEETEEDLPCVLEWQVPIAQV